MGAVTDWDAKIQRFLRGSRDERASAEGEILAALRGANADGVRGELTALIRRQRLADQYEIEELIERGAAASAPPAAAPAEPGVLPPALVFERDVHHRLFKDLSVLREELEARVAADAEDRDARLGLAMTLRRQAPDRARELLDALCEDGTDPRPWRELGWLDMGDPPRASEHVDRALAIHPSYPAGVALRGYLKFRAGDVDDATADLDRALSLDAEDRHIRFLRALTRTLQGDLQGAISEYDRLCEVDPEGADWWAERADLHARLGNLGEAKMGFNQAIRYEKTAKTLNRRAVVCLELGDQLAAESDLDEALELDEEYAAAWANRGSLRFEQRRDAEAAEALERAHALQPDDFTMCVSLAAAYTALDRAADALGVLEPVKDQVSDSADGLARLADALMRLGRHEEAVSALRHAISVDPENHLWGVALAGIGLVTADRPLAIEGVEHALAVIPPSGQKQRGVLEQTLGELSKGVLPPRRFDISRRRLARHR